LKENEVSCLEGRWASAASPEVQNSLLVNEARNVLRHVEVEAVTFKRELDPEALGLHVVVAT
jgi:hypothetical protein